MDCNPGIFDSAFYTMLPPPPLGAADPCYGSWLQVQRMSVQRDTVCSHYGASSEQCAAARELYFATARAYALCLDDVWGQAEF